MEIIISITTTRRRGMYRFSEWQRKMTTPKLALRTIKMITRKKNKTENRSNKHMHTRMNVRGERVYKEARKQLNMLIRVNIRITRRPGILTREEMLLWTQGACRKAN